MAMIYCEESDGLDLQKRYSIYFPWGFDPRVILGSTLLRFKLMCAPLITDTVVLDEEFFSYARGRALDVLGPPGVYDTIERADNPLLPIWPFIQFATCLGMQLRGFRV